MKRRKAAYSVFYKYLISFFLVAMLPIGIGVASFYQYNLRSLREQTGKISKQKFEQSAKLLDNVIYDHLRVASALAADSLLQSARLLGNSYEQYQSLSYIRPYLSRHQDVEKAYVIMNRKDMVYSASGIMSFETLCEMTLGFDSAQKEKLADILRENRKYLALGEELDERYLIFAYPIPTYSPYANLVFFMDKEKAAQMLTEGFTGGERDVALLNEEGERIWSEIEEEAFLQMGQEAFLTYRSESTGLTYMANFSQGSDFLLELENQGRQILIICFIMMFMCMGLAFVVASATYKPIRDMFRLLDKPSQRKNEMAALHEYIENQKELADSIHWQTPYVQQRIMELYLEGLVDEREQEKAFADFHFSGKENAYFAAVIMLKCHSGRSSSQYRQDILNFSMELQIKDGLHICHIEKGNEAVIVWIVNTDRKKQQTEVALQMQKELFHRFSGNGEIQYTVGIGDTVEELSNIRSSYYEALAAAEYLQKYANRDAVLLYGDLSEVLDKEEMPEKETVLKLVQALRKGDKAASCELFARYNEMMNQKYQSLILHQYFAAQFYKALAESLQDDVPGVYLEEFTYLATAGAEKEKAAQMTRLLMKICEHRTASQKSRQVDLAQKILEYIRANAFEPNLSLEQLGDEFGLSPYYISRFMTEQTGDNLKNYIAKLRIEEARKLLETTTLPLYEIVLRIGYLDVSSFIRKFKKEVGMTPGEYREKHHPGSAIRVTPT